MMDRKKKDDLPKMQVGFIDAICLPIYKVRKYPKRCFCMYACVEEILSQTRISSGSRRVNDKIYISDFLLNSLSRFGDFTTDLYCFSS